MTGAQGRSPELKRRTGGFTLIELIVVLIIIAALAGILIPQVAMLGRSTDMAASASNQRQLAANIQQYFLLQKRYPQGMDSLLHAGTNIATPQTLAYFAPLDAAGNVGSAADALTQISGLPRSGPDLWDCLEKVTLSAASNDAPLSGDAAKSLRRSFQRAGFDYLYDHLSIATDYSAGEANANDSAKIRRPATGNFGSGIDNLELVALKGSHSSLTAAPASRIEAIYRKLVPAEISDAGVYTPEPGTMLVALGIGPRSALTPNTALAAPVYPGCDGKYYGRYIAIFKLFRTGERCVLIGVVDSYGRTPDYTQQQFNESLPNNGRQG